LVDAGTTWNEINAETAPYGLAVPAPAGSNGVTRSTLSGAGGALSGQYGLACDNLLEVEVVTTDGAVVRAGPEENSELFWAVRGAGETVGIVTSLLFKLSPVAQGGVYAGNLMFPIEWGKETLKAEQVCSVWSQLVATLPESASISLCLATPPPEERPILAGRPIHRAHVGSMITMESNAYPNAYAHPCLVATCFYNGGVDEVGTSIFAPLVALGPAKNSLTLMPYADAANLTSWLNPAGDRYHHAGGIITGKPGSVWGTVSCAMHGVRSSPRLAVELQTMQGAVMAVDPSAMAFPHRFGGTRFRITGRWTGPADDASTTEAVDQLAAAIKAGGCLKPGIHLGDFVGPVDEAAAWGQQNASKVGALRAEYDPAMVLMVNHPAQ